MMRRGDRLVIALLVLMAVDTVCAVILFACVTASLLFEPEHIEDTDDSGFITLVTTDYKALEFMPAMRDRAVLETPQQVWEARASGTSEFDFDGVHYVISELPKEYVDYSAWYVRIP